MYHEEHPRLPSLILIVISVLWIKGMIQKEECLEHSQALTWGQLSLKGKDDFASFFGEMIAY